MQLTYVNGNKMRLNPKSKFDQYFTKKIVGEKLFLTAYNIIYKYEKENINKYWWLEPSVGEGCFWDNLPKNKRIGIDIDPKIKEIIKHDYLKYKLPNKPLIVIGNPPFGHRGVLALEFINHSEKADYICLILPMFFESLGKGSLRYRVKSFNLIHSEMVPDNAFYMPGKGDINVKCVFQIWSKNHSIPDNKFNWYKQKNGENPFSKILDVFTVSLAKKRECGLKWIHNKKANWYISSTFHKNNHVVNNFNKVKYMSGIAIIYKTKNKQLIKKLDKIFLTANWNKYSSLATNSCRHIGKSHIYQLLTDFM